MDKQVSAAIFDGLTAGTGVYQIGHRKWYNPMRWIKGVMYLKHIKLERMYLTHKR